MMLVIAMMIVSEVSVVLLVERFLRLNGNMRLDADR